MYQLQCSICRKPFNHSFSHTKVCSKECGKIRREKDLNRRAGVFKGIPTNTVAAIAELSVSTDLMKKGFYVFRALSQSSFCDLVAIKDKDFYQVEVRTGYKAESGKLFFPSHIRKTANLYAIWERSTQEITYLDKNKENIKL